MPNKHDRQRGIKTTKEEELHFSQLENENPHGFVPQPVPQRVKVPSGAQIPSGAQATRNRSKHMKWWGWGDPEFTFDASDRPDIWPFMTKKMGIDQSVPQKQPVEFDSIQLPTANINEDFLQTLKNHLSGEQIQLDKYERVVHAYGKSFRDLWRMRRGIVQSAPDCVVYPVNECEVIDIIKLANQFNVVVIPFGGGSNIAGCLEAKNNDTRMVVSLNMSRLNKVTSLDKKSRIAKIQAGAMGPELEEQLNHDGYSLGHFPDSFQFSSVGGWVATRSAGMQSDRYGKIEDMVISLRMVTPEGMIVTRDVPRCSNGIDMNHICIGSEGIFGVITEVTMRVKPLPVKKEYYAYLFPDLKSGIRAIYDCATNDCLPVMMRLNDSEKTALTFAFKTKSSAFKNFIGKFVKFYLRNIKKINFDKCCFLISCYEGDDAGFQRGKYLTEQNIKKYGGASLGKGPGRSFAKGKYDFPYLRDFVMDYNLIADVSETATTWNNVLSLYEDTMQAIHTAITETGSMPWVGCHLSHNYENGASLYFTFACLENDSLGLAQYLTIKKAAEDSFMRNHATLSHHHAVGYEHLPWLEEDISTTGVKVVKGLKQTLDPNNIMNPGKIIPPKKNPQEKTQQDWSGSLNSQSDLETF